MDIHSENSALQNEHSEKIMSKYEKPKLVLLEMTATKFTDVDTKADNGEHNGTCNNPDSTINLRDRCS